MNLEIGKEYFFIENGEIKSDTLKKTSAEFAIFSNKSRRKTYNIFETEVEAGHRLVFMISNCLKFSLGIKGIKHLKEVINNLENNPEYFI